MKRFFAFAIAVAALCCAFGCNRLSLPDNPNFQNSEFAKTVGNIDPAQTWNVARQGLTLKGLQAKLLSTKAMTKGDNGKYSIDVNAIEPTPAEYFRIIFGPNANHKKVLIKIEQIKSDMDHFVIGAYYYNDNKEKVEVTLFPNVTLDNYSDGTVEIDLQGGEYFGTWMECYDQGGNVTKYYSEAKYNSDGIGHAKYISKHQYIPETSNHPYIFMEDMPNETDCTDVILKICNNEDIIAENPDVDGLDSDKGPWMVICEDLGTTADNDFNDVVFTVQRVSPTKINIVFMAGGCTLPNYVFFGQECLGEIHAIFGVEDTKTMINTYEITKPFVTITKTVTEDFTMGSEDMGGFRISRSNLVEGIAYDYDYTGAAPLMICVPASFLWAKETVKIWDAYPRFLAWAQDHTVNTDWFDYPVEGKVVER